MSDRYNTNPDDAVLDASGVKPLPNGTMVTPTPLRDSKTGLRARMTSDQGETALARMGMRLLTRDEVDMVRASFLISPWEALPTLPMLNAAGVDSSNVAAINTYRDNNMSSQAWAKLEDDYIDNSLTGAGWDGNTPVLVGKTWFRDGPNSPPPGRGYLKGLWSPTTQTYVQAGASAGSPGPHASNAQFDYLTFTYGAVGPRLSNLALGPPVVPGVGLPGKVPSSSSSSSSSGGDVASSMRKAFAIGFVAVGVGVVALAMEKGWI